MTFFIHIRAYTWYAAQMAYNCYCSLNMYNTRVRGRVWRNIIWLNVNNVFGTFCGLQFTCKHPGRSGTLSSNTISDPKSFFFNERKHWSPLQEESRCNAIVTA